MIKIVWSGVDGKDDGSAVVANDEELMNYLMDNFSNEIEPAVYEAIESGFHVYSDLSEEQIEEIAEDTGQDTWDGDSLLRWMTTSGKDIGNITTEEVPD